MTINTIKILLIIFVSSNFFSCNGQVKSENNTTELTTLEFGKTVSKLDDKIWNIYQDSKGNYWFGSNGKGVYHFDGKNLKQITTDDGLINNTIRGIQEDNLRNIFIETPEGVSRFDGKTFTTLKVIKSPNNQWKLDLYDLWFNCNGNANNVYRYDGKNLYELQLPQKDIKNIFGINENEIAYSPYSVYGIDKDKKGNIWFGTVLAGAFRFDGKSFLWIGEKELSRLKDGSEPGVRSMVEDINGDMWLSNFISKYSLTPNDSNTYEKLVGVNLSNTSFANRFPYFTSGLIDNNGNLWMTTYGGGVWKFNGNKLFNFPIKNGETEVLLISIYKDNKGVLWLGTDNDGVYEFNGENFEKFEPMNQ